MKCPIDQSTLVMSDRQGIEIDYCPECRGVWLDRGELDKIVERSDRAASAPAGRHVDDDDDDDGGLFGRRTKKPKKRESFFSELFEMGG